MSEETTTSAPPIPGQIRVRGVSRTFKVMHDKALTLKETVLRRRRVVASEFQALEGIDLDVAPGEAVGIVGRNGSGKSTLLKILAGILSPHAGTVELGGTVTSMLELGSGFHPDFTGRENVLMNGAIHGFSEDEIAGRVAEIVDFAELWEFIDNPVRTYSSGMQMRLGYAVAAHLRPDVLLLDEVLSVGDEAFQRKCIANIFDYRRHGGTLVFVSHDPGAVERVCSRAVLMHDGHIVEEGPPGEVLADYRRLLVSTGAGARSGDVHEHDAPAPDAEPEPAAAPDVVLDGYRLLGPSGVTDRIMSGDSLAVEIDVVAEGGLGTVHVRVDVVSDEGPVVCESSHTADTPDGEVTRLRLDLPDLGLNTGGFSITFSLADQDLAPLEHRERVLPFNVFPRESTRAMLVASGTWTSASPEGTAAEAAPERPSPDRRPAIEEGFRVGGEGGHVLVVAGSDPGRTRGGGLAVYDGRRLEVIDRVSTTALAARGGPELVRILCARDIAAPGPLEVMTTGPEGLLDYRRSVSLDHVDGVALDGGSIVVAQAGVLRWIDPEGTVTREASIGEIADGARLRGLGRGPDGPVALIEETDRGVGVLDLATGRRLADGAGGASAVVAHESGWLIADRDAGQIVARPAASGLTRQMAIDAPSALARTDDVVAVGQRPWDPASPLGAQLLLLDGESLYPLVSVQLPFAGVSAIAACPAELVDGLRSAARDLHGILSAGRGREEGWILDPPAVDAGSGEPGTDPPPRASDVPALERR